MYSFSIRNGRSWYLWNGNEWKRGFRWHAKPYKQYLSNGRTTTHELFQLKISYLPLRFDKVLNSTEHWHQLKWKISECKKRLGGKCLELLWAYSRVKSRNFKFPKNLSIYMSIAVITSQLMSMVFAFFTHSTSLAAGFHFICYIDSDPFFYYLAVLFHRW